MLLVNFALRTPKDTLLVPAILDSPRARADTTAAVGRRDTVRTRGGTLTRRRLVDFINHLAVFLGIARYRGEAHFAAALRIGGTATCSRLALPHSRVSEKENEKEERKEMRECVSHDLPMRV